MVAVLFDQVFERLDDEPALRDPEGKSGDVCELEDVKSNLSLQRSSLLLSGSRFLSPFFQLPYFLILGEERRNMREFRIDNRAATS